MQDWTRQGLKCTTKFSCLPGNALLHLVIKVTCFGLGAALHGAAGYCLTVDAQVAFSLPIAVFAHLKALGEAQ